MTIYRVDCRTSFSGIDDWKTSCYIKTLKSAFEYILANVNQSDAWKYMHTIDNCYRTRYKQEIEGDITFGQIKEYYKQHRDMRVSAYKNCDTFRIVKIKVIED